LSFIVPRQSEGSVVDDFTQQVVDAAQQAVELCESRPGGKLDFTEASLSIVEEMLAEAARYAADLTPGQLRGYPKSAVGVSSMPRP
jgi:hypothetical protein